MRSQEAQEGLEIRKAAFHNKENETAIDRNGDIRSFFPWPACKRLFEFTSESVCNTEARFALLADEFVTTTLSAQNVCFGGIVVESLLVRRGKFNQRCNLRSELETLVKRKSCIALSTHAPEL